MSLTYGFYNSLNHDRRYNAIQMSSIFDGIIKDGIFMSIGDHFNVTAVGTDMFVTVGSGRAWFDHTWTLNDSLLPLEIPQSELILNRYDAIVLEVNSEQSVRANDIKVIKGTPSSTPAYPEMINTLTVHQYPLAYIYVEKGTSAIRQANITSMIGKATTPYVTGILETINIESMVAQWEDQWKKFFELETGDMTATNAAWKKQWEQWFNSYVDEMDETADHWKDLWHQWYHMYTDSSTEEFSNWMKNMTAEFMTWFEDLQAVLNDQVAAMLAAEIEALKKRADILEKFKEDLTKDQTIYEYISDSDDVVITDAAGDPIEGRIMFAGGSGGSGGEKEVFIGDEEPEIKYPLWVDTSEDPEDLVEWDPSIISDAFSPVKTYAKDTYCIHGDTLYRFTAEKGPGAWDPSVVQATNVDTELVGLKVTFTKVETFQVASFTASLDILRQNCYKIGNRIYIALSCETKQSFSYETGIAIIPEQYRPNKDVINVGIIAINGAAHSNTIQLKTLNQYTHGVIYQGQTVSIPSEAKVDLVFEYYL